jgi:hypothetical protein
MPCRTEPRTNGMHADEHVDALAQASRKPVPLGRAGERSRSRGRLQAFVRILRIGRRRCGAFCSRAGRTSTALRTGYPHCCQTETRICRGSTTFARVYAASTSNIWESILGLCPLLRQLPLNSLRVQRNHNPTRGTQVQLASTVDPSAHCAPKRWGNGNPNPRAIWSCP